MFTTFAEFALMIEHHDELGRCHILADRVPGLCSRDEWSSFPAVAEGIVILPVHFYSNRTVSVKALELMDVFY